MEITLTCSMTEVLNEVAQKAGYTAAKMVEPDAEAFDRISTVSADDNELLKMAEEVRVDICERVADMLVSEGVDESNVFSLVLDADPSLRPAMVGVLSKRVFVTLVYGVLSRWFLYTNKEESQAYATMYYDGVDALRSATMPKILRRRYGVFG